MMPRERETTHENIPLHIDGLLEGIEKDAMGKKLGMTEAGTADKRYGNTHLSHDELNELGHLLRGKALDE